MGREYLLYPQDGMVRVTSPFGMRNGRLHSGIDLASDNKGVDWNLASADGVVTNVGYSKADIGYWLEIRLDFKINGKIAYIRYYHQKEDAKFYDRKGSPRIRKGDKVRQGEKVGIEGNTGNSSGNHLHFELRLGGSTRAYAVDPIPYLRVEKGMVIDKGTLTQKLFKNVRYTNEIEVDGLWGTEFTKELQRQAGTTVDGVISGQYRNSITENIYSARFDTKKGSSLVRVMQRIVGVKEDGFFGKNTLIAWQKRLGTPQDGKLSQPSMFVKEMQRRLNDGTLFK